MKNFKDFISEEKPNIKRKAKGEQDFVDAHEVEVTDPENSGTEGPAKVNTKAGSGKRKADKDNKQEFGEARNPLDHGWQSSKEPGVMTRQKSGSDGHREYKIKHAGQTVQFKVPFTQDKTHGLSHNLAKIDHEGIRKHLTKKHGATGRNSSTLFGADHSDIVSGAKQYMEKNSVKEEVEELDEISVDLMKRAKEKMRDRAHVSRMVGDKPTSRYYAKRASNVGKRIKQKERKEKGFGPSPADKLSIRKEEVELDEEQLIEMDKSEMPFTPNKPKKNPPAKAGKYGQGPSTAKHLAKMGMKQAQKETQKEEVEEIDENPIVGAVARAAVGSAIRKAVSSSSNKEESYTNPGLEALAKKKKSLRQMKQGMKEADFSKQQTKMTHTIGKEFEKKGVGDQYKGGPYAVASAMVRDKPESAKKAYKTIQSKMKEEADTELLFKLYNDLNEENQEFFMHQLEEDAESLLDFAKMLEE